MKSADPTSESARLAAERMTVVAYLEEQGLVSPHVGKWPAWQVAPVLAIWAVESKTSPGSVGWWAISGDCPTDYVTCGSERHPRQAMRDFGQRWQAIAAQMASGQPEGDIRIGTADDARELAPLLAARANTLLEWAADDSLWIEPSA